MSKMRKSIEEKGLLGIMLDMLTSGYARADVRNARKNLPMATNIGKLFQTFAFGLDVIIEQSELIRLWDDLDNAQGVVLDRYGANFGVRRDGASDAYFRLMIRVKMVSLLSGGDINTVINAVSALFNVPVDTVELHEVFPAKIHVYVYEHLLDAVTFSMWHTIAAMIKRIIAAGVGYQLFLRTNHIYTSTDHTVGTIVEYIKESYHEAA